MQTYEVESVEGVGYLLFEMEQSKRARRVGSVFLNLGQARDFAASQGSHKLVLAGKSPYEEMINVDETPLH